MNTPLGLALFSLAVLIAVPAIHCNLQPTESFSHSASLAPNGHFKLFWKYDDKTITFEVHAKTKGYVGLGISPNGGMRNSDIVIGWVKDGKVYFTDRFAEGNAMPTVDPKQDWTLLEGKETDSHTILKFKRNLQTCDGERDIAIGQSTTRVIWSYHPDDPSSVDSVPYHGNGRRGVKSIYLLQNVTVPVNIIPADSVVVDLLLPNISIPAADTTYWCQGFKLPDNMKADHHIIKFNVVITPGNENLVHHVLLYMCTEPMEDTFHGFSQECTEANMPELRKCRQKTIYAWAVGAGPLYLPMHVGLKVKPGETFLMIDIHYDNPQKLSGLRDSSGVRMTLTPTLRSNEATLLYLGAPATTSMIVPPHYENFRIRHICTSSCFKKTIPEEGIKFIGSFLHTHYAGIEVEVYHIRKGQQMKSNLGYDSNYDFNYQEFRKFDKEITVKPDDTLVIDCVFKTTDRSNITWGGLATKQEMCIAFLMYYPATPLVTCMSVVLPTSLVKVADNVILTPDGKILSPPKYLGKPWNVVMHDVDWKKSEIRQKFQEIVLNSPLYSFCPIVGEGYHVQQQPAMPQLVSADVEDTSSCIKDKSTPAPGSKTTTSPVSGASGMVSSRKRDFVMAIVVLLMPITLGEMFNY